MQEQIQAKQVLAHCFFRVCM